MHLNIPFLAGRMDHGITAVLEQFLQAEQLLKQGHWSQAHYLLEDVLHYMPQHIHSAAHDEQTKPCQMACLITGLRDAAIAQSEISTTSASINARLMPSIKPMLCCNFYRLKKLT